MYEIIQSAKKVWALVPKFSQDPKHGDAFGETSLYGTSCTTCIVVLKMFIEECKKDQACDQARQVIIEGIKNSAATMSGSGSEAEKATGDRLLCCTSEGSLQMDVS